MEEPAGFSVEEKERRTGTGIRRYRGSTDLPGFPKGEGQDGRERTVHGEGVSAASTGARIGSGYSARHHAGRVGRTQCVGRETRRTDSRGLDAGGKDGSGCGSGGRVGGKD